MSTEKAENHTAEGDFERLIRGLGALSPENREKIAALAVEAETLQQRNRQSVHSLQESLDWLRLSVKYLLFDLEATRRENAYLREMLESQPGPSGESEGDEPTGS